MIKNIYLKVSIQFGLACALLIVSYFFTFYFLGDNPLLRLSTYDILIVLVCMAFAMGYYRDRLNGGKLHFWEGVYIGFLTNLIGTLLSTVAIYIFITFIDTEVVIRHLEEMKNLIVQTKDQVNETFGKEAYENTLKTIATVTPFSIALDVFIKKFFISFLTLGIIAAILRKH